MLLGEGYYAERTAKQTAEILRRRGKDLEAQIESLKAAMLDLEAEAKFFNSTAAEAAVSFLFFALVRTYMLLQCARACACTRARRRSIDSLLKTTNLGPFYLVVASAKVF